MQKCNEISILRPSRLWVEEFDPLGFKMAKRRFDVFNAEADLVAAQVSR
jgi:hypothetical protein